MTRSGIDSSPMWEMSSGSRPLLRKAGAASSTGHALGVSGGRAPYAHGRPDPLKHQYGGAQPAGPEVDNSARASPE